MGHIRWAVGAEEESRAIHCTRWWNAMWNWNRIRNCWGPSGHTRRQKGCYRSEAVLMKILMDQINWSSIVAVQDALQGLPKVRSLMKKIRSSATDLADRKGIYKALRCSWVIENVQSTGASSGCDKEEWTDSTSDGDQRSSHQWCTGLDLFWDRCLWKCSNRQVVGRPAIE